MARKTPAKVIEIIKTHANMRNGINSRAGLSQAEKIAALDAINNDKGYEPGNCRWATASEQQRNKRDKY